jgi:hypothetical protein
MSIGLTSAPEIEITNIPHGAKEIMRASADIILEALSNLSLRGKWEIAFVRQHTKKCNIRFQFVRQDPERQRTIHLRVKCGGKQTCWNVEVHVPDRYDPKHVADLFRTIHPRSLKVVRRLPPPAEVQTQPPPPLPANESPKPIAPTVPVVRVEEIVKPKVEPILKNEIKLDKATIELAVQGNSAVDIATLGTALYRERCRLHMLGTGWAEFCSKNNITPHIDACAQTLAVAILKKSAEGTDYNWQKELSGLTIIEGFQKFGINPDKPVHLPLFRIEDITEESPPPVVQTSNNPLRLDPIKHYDLVHNQNILDMGLLALQPYFDPNGVIERVPAIDILIDRMEVTAFIALQHYYKDARRAVSQILRGLVDYQFLTRWTYGETPRRTSKKPPTTRAFIITPKGREQLIALNAPLAEPSTHRPVLAIGTVAEETPPPVADSSVLLKKVEQQAEILQPLMNEHDSLVEDIAAYGEFLAGCEKEREAIQAEVLRAESQISDFEKEQARIAALLNEATLKHRSLVMSLVQIDEEWRSYNDEKDAAQVKLHALKNRIKDLLYGGNSEQKSARGA